MQIQFIIWASWAWATQADDYNFGECQRFKWFGLHRASCVSRITSKAGYGQPFEMRLWSMCISICVWRACSKLVGRCTTFSKKSEKERKCSDRSGKVDRYVQLSRRICGCSTCLTQSYSIICILHNARRVHCSSVRTNTISVKSGVGTCMILKLLLDFCLYDLFL